MIKLKMHALYDHFPEHNPSEGDRYLDCYADLYVQDCTSSGDNIAMLLEPRSMIGTAYEYVSMHPEYFKLIFTHDSELLRLPQAHYLNWADVWITTDSVKDKEISLCTSDKDWCELHRARLKLAEEFETSRLVDVYYGDWSSKETTVPAEAYLEHYKYSIIIENDVDDYWYTEKILNCFSTKTVPIYVGAKKISELFNAGGIIEAGDPKEIPKLLRRFNTTLDYFSRCEAIKDNFERVKPYKAPWKERFFRDYEKLMEDTLNGRTEMSDPTVHFVSAHHRGN